MLSANFNSQFDLSAHGLSSVDSELLCKLLSAGLITDGEIRIITREYQANNEDLNSILTDFGFINKDTFNDFLQENYGYNIFNIANETLSADLIRRLPKNIAIRNKALLISEDENNIHFVTKDIMNLRIAQILSSHLGTTKTLVPHYCKLRDILDAIEQYYDEDSKETLDALVLKLDNKSNLDAKHDPNSTSGIGAISVDFVDKLFADAVKTGASDIHIEPDAFFLRIRLRIDGVLHKKQVIHKKNWGNILNRIKVLGNMNITETRKPQDGRIEMTFSGRPVDFRLSIHPTMHGENIVIRILDRNKSLVSLQDLGISDYNYKKILQALGKPEGIIIVTGPTGSGKTTTLYSCLSSINSGDVNIMTLENPVEYTMPLIRQTSVREDIGLSFDGGIRSIMRQDPDVIMIGEIRDLSTAQAAIRASLTGHKVLSTLHTIDSISVVQRLIDIGVDKHMLSGNLIAIVAQRLIRKLCDFCKEPYAITDENIKELKLPDSVDYSNVTLFNPTGCEKCNKVGFRGRTIISEVLSIDEDLDELISTTMSRKQIFDMAKKKGFVTLSDDVVDRVLMGTTSIQEAKRVVKI